ncbi:hypothetical protein [Achromobacter pestifer]
MTDPSPTDSPRSAPGTKDAARPVLPRATAWSLALTAGLGMAVLVYVVNSLLPWSQPGGVYGGMGVMMLLPYLLMGAVVSVGISSVAVFGVALRLGLGGIAATVCVLLGSALALAGFVMGAMT